MNTIYDNDLNVRYLKGPDSYFSNKSLPTGKTGNTGRMGRMGRMNIVTRYNFRIPQIPVSHI